MLLLLLALAIATLMPFLFGLAFASLPIVFRALRVVLSLVVAPPLAMWFALILPSLRAWLRRVFAKGFPLDPPDVTHSKERVLCARPL